MAATTLSKGDKWRKRGTASGTDWLCVNPEIFLPLTSKFFNENYKPKMVERGKSLGMSNVFLIPTGVIFFRCLLRHPMTEEGIVSHYRQCFRVDVECPDFRQAQVFRII
jgi:hypothetical protein